MKYHRREFPVEKMCKVLKVSRSGYYEWQKHVPSRRDNENRRLLFEIRHIHAQSQASYGSPRMTDELKARGFMASRPRVARIMRQNRIRAVHQMKFVVTTDSNHKYPLAENKLDSYSSVTRSMSRKGNCWDNAVAESFFKTLKVEFIYQNRFSTYQEASLAIFEWIETWYNKNRRHSALGSSTSKNLKTNQTKMCGLTFCP